MTNADVPAVSWVDRAVERSAAVQRSRVRIAAQVRQMLDAARRLIAIKGDTFTTQELVAEAGVALQTFYRYFATKDDLLLAVIGDAMTEACDQLLRETADIPDPMVRLRYYVMSTLERLDGDGNRAAMSRFVVSTRWRLHRHVPEELAEAERPFVDLLRNEVAAAADAGLLNLPDTEWAPCFIAELVRSVYHYFAFVSHADGELDMVNERLWQFCLAGLGGTVTSAPTLKGVVS